MTPDNNLNQTLQRIQRLLNQNLILMTLTLVLTSMLFALVLFCPDVQEKLKAPKGESHVTDQS